MYDALSLRFVKYGTFNPLIRLVLAQENIDTESYKSVARILELCACHSEGIAVLHLHLPRVVSLVETFLHPDTELLEVKYPAATVLLDLTANE